MVRNANNIKVSGKQRTARGLTWLYSVLCGAGWLKRTNKWLPYVGLILWKFIPPACYSCCFLVLFFVCVFFLCFWPVNSSSKDSSVVLFFSILFSIFYSGLFSSSFYSCIHNLLGCGWLWVCCSDTNDYIGKHLCSGRPCQKLSKLPWWNCLEKMGKHQWKYALSAKISNDGYFMFRFFLTTAIHFHIFPDMNPSSLLNALRPVMLRPKTILDAPPSPVEFKWRSTMYDVLHWHNNCTRREGTIHSPCERTAVALWRILFQNRSSHSVYIPEIIRDILVTFCWRITPPPNLSPRREKICGCKILAVVSAVSKNYCRLLWSLVEVVGTHIGGFVTSVAKMGFLPHPWCRSACWILFLSVCLTPPPHGIRGLSPLNASPCRQK